MNNKRTFFRSLRLVFRDFLELEAERSDLIRRFAAELALPNPHKDGAVCRAFGLTPHAVREIRQHAGAWKNPWEIPHASQLLRHGPEDFVVNPYFVYIMRDILREGGVGSTWSPEMLRRLLVTGEPQNAPVDEIDVAPTTASSVFAEVLRYFPDPDTRGRVVKLVAEIDGDLSYETKPFFLLSVLEANEAMEMAARQLGQAEEMGRIKWGNFLETVERWRGKEKHERQAAIRARLAARRERQRERASDGLPMGFRPGPCRRASDADASDTDSDAEDSDAESDAEADAESDAESDADASDSDAETGQAPANVEGGEKDAVLRVLRQLAA